MFTEEKKAIVYRFFEENPSRGNLNATDELLSPAFSIHVPLSSSLGVKGINEIITACRAAFEHLNVTVEDMIAEDNTVTARFIASSVHRTEVAGLPATDKRITMTEIEIFLLRMVRFMSCRVKLIFWSDATTRDCFCAWRRELNVIRRAIFI